MGRLLLFLALIPASIQLSPPLTPPRGMVRIAASSFVMGTDPARIDALLARFNTKRRELFLAEAPAHRVDLTAFSIDRTEVTNAAFRDFLEHHPEWRRDRLASDQQNGDYLKTWIDGGYPAGAAELPVNYVTWGAADAYCRSVGGRLPTEAEWEFAAGAGRSEFPWGDEPPDPQKANWSATGAKQPLRVGSFPPNASGLYDMAGNVWEFVQERWANDYSGVAVSPDRRTIRGGSYDGAPINLRVRYRDSHPANGAVPHVGFRCAAS